EKDGGIEQPPVESYGGIYGKAGDEAVESFREWKARPGEERTAALRAIRSRLAAQHLVPNGSAVYEGMTRDEIVKGLMQEYNHPSAFYANMAIDIAGANLTIELGREPEPAEIAEALDQRARAFAAYYSAKPSLRQLAFAVAEYAFYSHSHETAVAEFFGVTDQHVLKEIDQMKAATVTRVSDKNIENEADVIEICRLLGIEVGKEKLNDAQMLITTSNFISHLCYNAIRNEDCIETVLLAKALLGDVNGVYGAKQVITVLENALKRNRFDAQNVRRQHLNAASSSTVNGYFAKHYGREATAREVKAFDTIVKALNNAYPASVLNFNPQRGFVRYNTQATIDGSALLPEPPGSSGGGGTMGKFNPYGNRFVEVLRRYGLSADINPMRAGPKVKAAIAEIRESGTYSRLKRFAEMFDSYRSGGQKGIRFDMDSERPDGCLSSEEVLEKGYALCLEHAFLFLALNRDLPGKTLAFKVFRDAEGRLIPHICNGALINDTPYSNATMLAHAAEAQMQPRVLYQRFDEDAEFRASVMRRLGGEEGAKQRLLLIDLSQCNFGAQYQEVRPMTTDEEILSAYFVDRGSYFMRTDRKEEALASFDTALRINSGDELARSHLVAYYSDIDYKPEKVLELTADASLLVNTEDFVSRALVLVSLGRHEEAVAALLGAVQLSENAVKARILLMELVSSTHYSPPQK
ncbi:MAG: hypothetical protein HZA83_03520, partial [Thaumarchaeota archaeon]|nr:hypothetical protein [Nitrososphaerota archaeon]